MTTPWLLVGAVAFSLALFVLPHALDWLERRLDTLRHSADPAPRRCHHGRSGQ